MKKSTLYGLWAGLFIICAGLGFIPEPLGAARVILTILSVLFFVPPAWLLVLAAREQDGHTLKLVRNLSILSLSLTLLMLVVNLLTVLRSEILGNIVYYMLVILSSPMICCGYWAVSLFLWACLLVFSLQQLKKL